MSKIFNKMFGIVSNNKVVKNNTNNKIKTLKIIHNTKYNNKNLNECKFQIPANIFQTWQFKSLPPLMMRNINYIQKNNSKFNYYLFDDNECEKFISENFPENVLNAYKKLIPGAYKADLWRYCILYRFGGIYMDIKYKPINGFKLYNLLEKEHWVLDADGNNIYNAIMVCKPGNKVLLKAIEKICENVKNNYYGSSFLEPTGPALLANFFSQEEKKHFNMKHVVYGNNDYEKVVRYNRHNVFGCYSGYFEERNRFSNKQHYSHLWNTRNIYL